MSSFSGTFSADNQVSNAITLSPGQSVSYSITTAALTGSVVFEKTTKVGKGYSTVDTMTATDSGTYTNESASDEIVRLRCVALDEGAVETVTYTLADATTEAAQDFINPATGLYELRFTNDGAELRRQLLLGASPTSDSHAATKSYVDTVANGLKWKQSVKAATTANGTLATAFANGQTVDGVTLATGDRILIKDQSTGSENGIYTVNASGAPTRATDADSGSELVAASVNVEQGTSNADTDWVCTNNSITLGSTSITFVSKSSTTSHNSTAGLQGGTTAQYYHLTSAQHTAVSAMVTAGLNALTSAEVDQLENIGSSVISAGQWGYLGGMNQALATTNSVQFTGITIKNTGTPTLTFKDDDAIDDDANATIAVNLTATGSGAENADVTFAAQVAGALTTFFSFDADGRIDLIPFSGNARVYNATGNASLRIESDAAATGYVGIEFYARYSSADAYGQVGFNANNGVLGLYYDSGLNSNNGISVNSSGYVGIKTVSPASALEVEETKALTGNVTDSYTAGITLDPGYSVSNGGSYTVTRLNYIDANNPSKTETSGTIAITDACLVRYDAAAGTHLAVDSGTTKTTPVTVNAWEKRNVNGTIYYVPMYTSKTA